MASSTRRRTTYGALVLAVVLLVALVALVAVVRRDSDEARGDESAADRRPILGVPPDVAESVKVLDSLEKGVPVGKGNFADPFVLVDGDVVYAYATNVRGANIPVSRSLSVEQAEYLGDALPSLPSWTSPGAVWAPSVYRRADGTYVMFYNSTFGITGRQCVSRATSSDPAGPFVDDSRSPFACPIDEGGAIDASMITVDGQPWLIYKSDGNCCHLPTAIWSVPLSDDLMSIEGTPTRLITADQSWEDDVVEAPEMVEEDGTYVLFYSGNDWRTADYAVGYATCESVTGPCTKPDEGPFHASTRDADGPGGQTFFVAGEQVVMAYHAWLPGHVDTRTGERELFLAEIDVGGATPSLTPYR